MKKAVMIVERENNETKKIYVVKNKVDRMANIKKGEILNEGGACESCKDCECNKNCDRNECSCAHDSGKEEKSGITANDEHNVNGNGCNHKGKAVNNEDAHNKKDGHGFNHNGNTFNSDRSHKHKKNDNAFIDEHKIDNIIKNNTINDENDVNDDNTVKNFNDFNEKQNKKTPETITNENTQNNDLESNLQPDLNNPASRATKDEPDFNEEDFFTAESGEPATIPEITHSKHVAFDESKNTELLVAFDREKAIPREIEEQNIQYAYFHSLLAPNEQEPPAVLPDCELHQKQAAGMVLFEGKLFKKRSFFKCCWVQRFFVLTTEGVLIYFNDLEGSSKVFVAVENVEVVTRELCVNEKYKYQIYLGTGRIENIMAFDSLEARDAWAAKIAAAMRRFRMKNRGE